MGALDSALDRTYASASRGGGGRNVFLETMGSFQGAADIVIGMEGKKQALRANNLAAARSVQEMEFADAMQPLKMQLMRETIATQHLDTTLKGFSLLQAFDARQASNTADAATHMGFKNLFQEYSAWRGGNVGAATAIGAPGVPVAADDLGIYGDAAAGFAPSGAEGLGEVAPGGDATGGGLIPDGMEDPTIPFTDPAGLPNDAPSPVIEGQGDGSAPVAGVVLPADEQWLAAKANGGASIPPIAQRELAARAAKSGTGAVAAAPVLPAVPRSLILKRKFELMMQAAGGPRGMETRFKQWLPQVAEAVANLEYDPEAAAWKVAQAAAVKRQSDKNAVLGKVLSAGLPAEEFAGVLGAIEAGLPVDPGTIDARIKAGLDAKAEMAKLYASKGDMSLAGGYFMLPEAVRKRTEDLATAYTKSPEYTNFTLASGFAASVSALADAQNALVDAKKSPSAAGDIAMVFNYMKVLDPGSAVREGEYATAQNAASIPTRIQNLYNKALEGNFLTKEQREEFKVSAQTSLIGLKATLQGRQALIEGQLAGVVPPALMPVVRQQVFGEGAAPVAPVSLLDAAQPLVFSTPEELSAAVAKGLIKPGQTLNFQGRIIKYQPGAK